MVVHGAKNMNSRMACPLTTAGDVKDDPKRVSRRSFLCSVSGSALLLRSSGAAGAELERPASFAIVSDTHLGYRGSTVARERWAAAAEELRRSDAAFVLHLGDIVDDGREDEYPAYRRIRDSIGKPVHEIPGNHDPVPLFKKYVHEPIDRSVDYESLRFILMNNARFGSHDGFLTDDQLSWLDSQCAIGVANGQSLFICMHVPAHFNVHPDRGWYVKPEHGQTRYYEVVARHQQHIRAVFHGHFHNGIRGWADRPPEIACPSTLYNQDRNLEEQGAPGYNPNEFRPGYVLVRVTREDVTIRYKPLNAVPTIEKRLPPREQSENLSGTR